MKSCQKSNLTNGEFSVWAPKVQDFSLSSNRFYTKAQQSAKIDSPSTQFQTQSTNSHRLIFLEHQNEIIKQNNLQLVKQNRILLKKYTDLRNKQSQKNADIKLGEKSLKTMNITQSFKLKCQPQCIHERQLFESRALLQLMRLNSIPQINSSLDVQQLKAKYTRCVIENFRLDEMIRSRDAVIEGKQLQYIAYGGCETYEFNSHTISPFTHNQYFFRSLTILIDKYLNKLQLLHKCKDKLFQQCNQTKLYCKNQLQRFSQRINTFIEAFKEVQNYHGNKKAVNNLNGFKNQIQNKKSHSKSSIQNCPFILIQDPNNQAFYTKNCSNGLIEKILSQNYLKANYKEQQNPKNKQKQGKNIKKRLSLVQKVMKNHKNRNQSCILKQIDQQKSIIEINNSQKNQIPYSLTCNHPCIRIQEQKIPRKSNCKKKVGKNMFLPR